MSMIFSMRISGSMSAGTMAALPGVGFFHAERRAGEPLRDLVNRVWGLLVSGTQ